jgi:hypothetical protein
MTMSKFVIVRTSPATGRKMYLTESRSAGVSFEALGNTVTGVGVANLKTWTTTAGAQRWMNARAGFAEGYAKAGIPLTIEPAL